MLQIFLFYRQFIGHRSITIPKKRLNLEEREFELKRGSIIMSHRKFTNWNLKKTFEEKVSLSERLFFFKSLCHKILNMSRYCVTYQTWYLLLLFVTRMAEGRDCYRFFDNHWPPLSILLDLVSVSALPKYQVVQVHP